MIAIAWALFGLMATALGVLSAGLFAAFGRIDGLGTRIDGLGTRIDAQGASLGARIDGQGAALGARIDAETARIDALNRDMHAEFRGVHAQIVELDQRLTRAAG